MIEWFEALVLGAVQGATEYLPVSSSGHLVLFQHLFGLTEPALLFDIVLHVATLVVVLWYYRRDLVELLQQSLAAIQELMQRRISWSRAQDRYPAFKLAWLIVVGTVPTALIGITLQDTFESLFGSLRAVGVMLWVTGMILLATKLARRTDREIGAVSWIDALLIGLVQGLAITPGISRSGSTIGVALLLGIERETAARYSFLLSVPSIIGALMIKIGDTGNGVGIAATALGFVAAFATGVFCLVFLVRVVKKGQLAWFAPYCFLIGAMALLAAGREESVENPSGSSHQIVDQVGELLLPTVDVELSVLLAGETGFLEQQRGATAFPRQEGPFDQSGIGFIERAVGFSRPAPGEPGGWLEGLDAHGEPTVLFPSEPALATELGAEAGAVAEPAGHFGGVGQGAPDLLG